VNNGEQLVNNRKEYNYIINKEF